MKKVLLALSGGVDSSVSLHLLKKAGYHVEAVYMKNWSNTFALKNADCPWLGDRRDAARVAAVFGVPLHTLNFEKAYREKVLEHFFEAYESGHTPNPDVECNREIKFRLLYAWAMEHGFDYLATGHYARVELVHSCQLRAVRNKKNRRQVQCNCQQETKNWKLTRSVDEFKDQTYFIHSMPYEDLPHLLFPVGGMKKAEVKTLARKLVLPTVGKKESMGVCFVGRILLKEFLSQRLKSKIGSIVDLDSGKVLGTHEGLFHYTLGQRQGIKVASVHPYYVAKKDLKKNILYVTNNPTHPVLLSSGAMIHSMNWLLPQVEIDALKSKKQKLQARYRHQGELVPCTVNFSGEEQWNVEFATPQQAVVSGQALVLYDGKTCLGGGTIS